MPPAGPRSPLRWFGRMRSPRSRHPYVQTPRSTNFLRASIALHRLGDLRAARSGSQRRRTNADMRFAYSGPTSRPPLLRGTMASLTSDRRERRHKLTSSRLGLSKSSGLPGTWLRPTENSSLNPSTSARIQLSTARTGTRMLTRDDGLLPDSSLRTSSGGHDWSRSRSRMINQFRFAPDRFRPGIFESSLDLPPATSVRTGSTPIRRSIRSAIGTSVSPSTAKYTTVT